MFYDIHSYKMISNKRIYVKYFLFTGAKRRRKRYASVLNHLLYEFFLLRSTIITTTIAAIERIANNPISIRVQKTSKDGSKDPLKGATYALYKVLSGEGRDILISAQISDENGYMTFEYERKS